MTKKSAGILAYRFNNENILEVFLAHPGGPFWSKKDKGVWTIPKGEFSENESPIVAAKREFLEETGITITENCFELSPLKQKSGKIIYVFCLLKNIDAENIKSNTFELEFPLKSGNKKTFPEIEKAAWFPVEEAKEKILDGQWPFIEELVSVLKHKS
jgi:predicted NUDIX family NTP pyrophosphohydrolase